MLKLIIIIINVTYKIAIIDYIYETCENFKVQYILKTED